VSGVAALLLSLAVYGLLCASIARLYVRTGHGIGWMAISFLPLIIVLVLYGFDLVGYAPALIRKVLPLVVLVYLGLLVMLAVKRWPVTNGRSDG
jgi:hypothetical protein